VVDLPQTRLRRTLGVAFEIAYASFATLITFLAAIRIVEATEYLSYVWSHNQIDVSKKWVWLSIAEVCFGLVGILGLWATFAQRRYAIGLLFGLLTFVLPIVIEANRCDVEGWFCRSTQWLVFR
jgi:hypothetical protein